MSWMQQVSEFIGNYANTNASESGVINNEIVENHYDRVARVAPQATISSGLSEAFQSDRTPPLAEMLGNLFNHSSDSQKAGVLNELVQSAGPSILSRLGITPTTQTVSPSVANTVSPTTLQNAVTGIENNSPGLIGAISSFYSQHPDLVKRLGGVALTIAMAKMANSTHVM